MATRHPPPSPPPYPGVSLMDCPQCGSLCLGASLLPCGHLSCRKCLRDLLQQRGPHPACRTCRTCIPLPLPLPLPGDPDLTVSQLVQQLGTDPVMQQLVHQRLKEESDVNCVVCPNKKAAKVCLDCQDYFCESCSTAHGKQKATKDHVLQLLPGALLNPSSAASATASPRSSPRRVSSSSAASISNPTDPTPGGQSRDASRAKRQWKQWVDSQVRLLQEAARDQHSVVTAVKDMLSLGEQLLKMAETQEHVIDTYAACLPGYDVIEQTDTHAYVISPTSAEVSVEVHTESLERRLRDVRESRQRAQKTDVDSIRTQLSQLLLKQGESAPDPMTATPRRVFESTPSSDGDTKTPWISAIVNTRHGRLVMADRKNSKVKVVDLTDQHTVTASLHLDEATWGLALLSDGLVAVTTGTNTIYLLGVDSHVTLESQLQTDREYWGVAGNSNDTLIVSCYKDGDGPARVDVITRHGDVVRTVTDGSRLTGLKEPYYLCVADGHVWVSDFLTHTVHRVELTTGRVVDTLTHTDMKNPQQVSVDWAGNVYVASGVGRCVLVRSGSGKWRRLLQGPRDSQPEYDRPRGVCVTSRGVVVVAWRKGTGDSVLIGYDME